MAERYWHVWCDDTPITPEVLLDAEQAARWFLSEVKLDPDARVEIRQADEESIAWAKGVR